MQIVRLRLPYPPSVNHYWFRNRNGGMRIGTQGQAFRIATQSVVNRSGAGKMKGKLYVEILARPPDKRRRDIDNLLKATLDALQHANLYEDDNQINRIEICRGIVIKGGVLAVEVGLL